MSQHIPPPSLRQCVCWSLSRLARKEDEEGPEGRLTKPAATHPVHHLSIAQGESNKMATRGGQGVIDGAVIISYIVY